MLVDAMVSQRLPLLNARDAAAVLPARNVTRRHHGRVSVSSSILAELLPPDSGEWVPVTGGESGASVVYDCVQQRYAKVVASLVPELAAERDRIVWLNETGIPGAALLDWRESDAGACLVTRAVPGVPANRLDAPALQRVWPSVVCHGPSRARSRHRPMPV